MVSCMANDGAPGSYDCLGSSSGSNSGHGLRVRADQWVPVEAIQTPDRGSVIVPYR
jgi:hypothetical protein